MAGKDWLVKAVFLLGILLYLWVILMSFVWANTGFVPETIIFIVLIVLFYWMYDIWDFRLPIFTVLILSFLPHAMGFMGFYLTSPLPFGFAYDHFTHILPCLAFALFFFQFLSRFMARRFLSAKTLFLIIVVILAASGIGVIIELFEFSGFLINGFGEGGLAFGAGDACQGQLVSTFEEIDAYGGGWFNTMYDLIWNSIGVLAGTFIMVLAHFIVKKKEKNLFGNY
jgi:hypothetical protein